MKWSAVPGAAGYRVHWRRTDASDWTAHRDVAGNGAVIKDVSVDDHFFGVSALSATGAESVVSFAGPARP